MQGYKPGGTAKTGIGDSSGSVYAAEGEAAGPIQHGCGSDENTDPSAHRAEPVERDLHGPTDGRTKDITIGSNAVGIAETGAAPFAGALDIGLKAEHPRLINLPIVTDLATADNAIQFLR